LKYIATQLGIQEKKLSEIQKLEQNPTTSLTEKQIMLVREKKDNLDQILVFTQMKQHYQTFLTTQVEDQVVASGINTLDFQSY
jgi:hypothetical protein